MHPLVNLQHLKFFCDAVTYESISEAAKMNFISQSAISQAIHKLEAIFGNELIFFNRQRVQLTDAGKVVYEQALLIFRSVKETFDKVALTKQEICGCLHFVTTKSLGMSFIAPAYQAIRTRYPLLDFKFRMGGLNLIRTALRREEAEFAIVVYDDNFDSFAKHPLKKGLVRLFQSQQAPDHFIEKGVFVYDEAVYLKQLKKALGNQLKIQDTLASWELIARFVELNLGVGFFPDYIVDSRYPNIVPHPIPLPPFEYEIAAIYNKGQKLSRSASALLEHLTQLVS